MTIQQMYTKWSIPETTTSCILGSDEEKKEIVKNRMNHEHRQAR